MKTAWYTPPKHNYGGNVRKGILLIQIYIKLQIPRAPSFLYRIVNSEIVGLMDGEVQKTMNEIILS